MSSPLERLPPELFSQICDTINGSQEYHRQHHTTFLNLSLVSKKCRSYSMPYIFDRLFLKETCLGDSASSLENCIRTLGRLNVLGFVKEIDVAVPITRGRCEWEYEKESVVRLLDQLPNLTRLYIRTSEVLTGGLVDEVQQVLLHCSSRLEAEKPFDHYWWWYSMWSQSELRMPTDDGSTSMTRCRLVRLFERNKRRRPPLVFSYSEVQHQHVSQHISISSRLTYLFLIN
jgi:hypothetical protein